jgi:hypothetical protein
MQTLGVNNQEASKYSQILLAGCGLFSAPEHLFNV